MSNVTRILAAVAAGLVLATATTAPAEAVRPIAGYNYPDLCRNVGNYAMPGKQTVLQLTWGYVEFVEGSEPNERGRRACVPGWRTH